MHERPYPIDPWLTHVAGRANDALHGPRVELPGWMWMRHEAKVEMEQWMESGKTLTRYDMVHEHPNEPMEYNDNYNPHDNHEPTPWYHDVGSTTRFEHLVQRQ